MGRISPRRGSRATVYWCILVALAWLAVPAADLAAEVRATFEFQDVVYAVERYAEQYGPEHVLLVVDVDNTLLAMNQPLGSDQWFEWQDQLLKNQPDSSLLVAKSFDGLLQAQGLMYSVGRMHPPQRDLPTLVARLQDLGITTLVLTSRGDDFRAATERELQRNGYDLARSALAVRDLPAGTYLPYDPADPQAAGFSAAEFASFELDSPRPVAYAKGIFMTAGQHKGAMLLAILHHAVPDIRAIVFVDDHQRNVERVFAATTGHEIETTAFRYRREDPNVRAFQRGGKWETVRRWRCLSRAYDTSFE